MTSSSVILIFLLTGQSLEGMCGLKFDCLHVKYCMLSNLKSCRNNKSPSHQITQKEAEKGIGHSSIWGFFPVMKSFV